MIDDEIRFVKNDYNVTTKNNFLKPLLLTIIKSLIKAIFWVGVGIFQLCIVIFMIIIFAPLYMFFGVKPKYRRKRRW